MGGRTEFVADFLEEPVPMTSLMKATWNPLFFSSAICALALVTPSRGVLQHRLGVQRDVWPGPRIGRRAGRRGGLERVW